MFFASEVKLSNFKSAFKNRRRTSTQSDLNGRDDNYKV